MQITKVSLWLETSSSSLDWEVYLTGASSWVCSFFGRYFFICISFWSTVLYLLLYIDDIIITGNVPVQISNLVHALNSTFELKELSPLNYFLGIQITPTRFGLILSQSKYASDVLHRFNMHNSKPTKTLWCSATSLTPTTGYLLTDPTTYRSMVGALQYLTFTRPYLAFSVQQLCQFMLIGQKCIDPFGKLIS